MRRAERAVTDREAILQIIDACDCCRVGFCCEDGAYIVPLNFAFVPGTPDCFYFHGAKEGRKATLIAQKPTVGFELDCGHALLAGQSACSYSYRYRSVIGTGVICEVTQTEEKRWALSAMMEKYEKTRAVPVSDEQAQRVAVFRLTVAQMSAKERR